MCSPTLQAMFFSQYCVLLSSVSMEPPCQLWTFSFHRRGIHVDVHCSSQYVLQYWVSMKVFYSSSVSMEPPCQPWTFNIQCSLKNKGHTCRCTSSQWGLMQNRREGANLIRYLTCGCGLWFPCDIHYCMYIALYTILYEYLIK